MQGPGVNRAPTTAAAGGKEGKKGDKEEKKTDTVQFIAMYRQTDRIG